MKKRILETDVNALEQRILCHEKYGSYDLNRWVFDHIELAEGLSILELGCGIGKQTLQMAQMIGDTGHLLAVDISKEALDTLMQRAKELKLQKRIEVLCAGFDEVWEYLGVRRFDRVLGCYSLYYAKNPEMLFRVVLSVMNQGGILFFCGPSKNNNDEIKRFHYALRGEEKPARSEAAVFMEETGQKITLKLFHNIETFAFQNPIRFDTVDALYSYWSSYGLYDEELDADFKAAAEKYFQFHSIFETNKHVIGVRAMKQKVGN